MATTANVTTYQIIARSFGTNSSVITITGLSGTTTVKVNVYFVKTGSPIPSPTVGTAPLLLETFLPESSYMAWVDLLRNEKPLTMNVNGTAFYVQTGQEAVGAHELGA